MRTNLHIFCRPLQYSNLSNKIWRLTVGPTTAGQQKVWTSPPSIPLCTFITFQWSICSSEFLSTHFHTQLFPRFLHFLFHLQPRATPFRSSVVGISHLNTKNSLCVCLYLSPSICVIVSLSVNYVDVWNFPMSLLCILPFLTTSSGYLIKKLLPKQGGVPRYILRTFEPR